MREEVYDISGMHCACLLYTSCMALGGVLCCFVYSSSARSRIRRSVFSQPRQASVMLLP